MRSIAQYCRPCNFGASACIDKSIVDLEKFQRTVQSRVRSIPSSACASEHTPDSLAMPQGGRYGGDMMTAALAGRTYGSSAPHASQ
jgi:hypothetical protein